MKKLIGFLTAAVMTAVMLCSGVTASALTLSRPQVKLKTAYADQVILTVGNLSAYPSNAKFGVYRSGRLIKTTAKTFASGITIEDSGVTYLKPDTVYTYNVVPMMPGSGPITSLSTTIKVKTAAQTSYRAAVGAQVVKLSGSAIKTRTKLTKACEGHGVLVAADGKAVAGKSLSDTKAMYVKFTDGAYKGWYVRTTQAKRIAEPKKSHEQEIAEKRKIVCDYAASMDGGYYVWGGAAYRACDCSGLTMLAYKQVGIDLYHSAYAQSLAGIGVSYNDMQPGDIICMNYGGHVGLYLGNGQVVHALNPNDGIKITPLSYLKYFHIDCVRRLLY